MLPMSQARGPRIPGPTRERLGLGSWLWTWLPLLFAGVLMTGCGAEGEPEAQGPAVAVPTGVAALAAVTAVDAVMPAPELLAVFGRLAGAGVTTHSVAFAGAPALLLVTVDLDRLQPLVVGTDGGQRVGVTAREALHEFGAELVVGSSFVSELNSISPVGLLQIEGNTISELQRHGYTRVLGVRGNQLGVVSIREYHRGMFDSAVQVGPGVVEGGLLDISERDLQRPRYFRTLVATCGSTAVVGASLVPMNLHSLGRLFLEFAEARALPCDELVNLAGDREVVLAIASPDRERMAYVGHPGTTKAGLIGFRRLEAVGEVSGQGSQ